VLPTIGESEVDRSNLQRLQMRALPASLRL